MSRFGVDYSFAKPTVAELKAAGVTFACRYVGTPSSGKNLTLVEADALTHAGIDIVANYEASSAGWMQGGRTAGVNAAKAAHADATRLGMPTSRPIYFSADYNATYDQYKTQIKPCLEGTASVIGVARNGIYGGIEQVDWAFGDGLISWVWQTYAWSYGQWSKHSRIQQWKNGQTLGSGTVDYNRAIVADFGQWRQPQEDLTIVDQATQDYLDAKFAAAESRIDTLEGRLDRAVLFLGGVSNSVYSDSADAPRPLPDMAKTATLKDAVNAANASADPDTVAALIAGKLEIVGISTDPAGTITVTFGPRA